MCSYGGYHGTSKGIPLKSACDPTIKHKRKQWLKLNRILKRDRSILNTDTTIVKRHNLKAGKTSRAIKQY
jgi:hypothetical protein